MLGQKGVGRWSFNDNFLSMFRLRNVHLCVGTRKKEQMFAHVVFECPMVNEILHDPNDNMIGI